MAFCNDSLLSRIQQCFHMPIADRCIELTNLLDCIPLRELQDIFPYLVHSIFGTDTGGIGWGLRITTETDSPFIFSLMHQFFTFNGIMMRCCHRLVNDAIKFEVDVSLLPPSVHLMLQTAQRPLFYADLLNIGPFQREIVSLVLNAFDFYILHFVLHGLQPLHTFNATAYQINTERSKTAYYLLTADYLNNFMPTHPDAEIYPTNANAPVKAQSFIPPAPILQPKTRYLKVIKSYDNNPNMALQNNVDEQIGSRAYAWRTESILHFFIDNWLRSDCDEKSTSNEFVRCVRLLIKQTHFFANSAAIDKSGMASLRKMAHSMIRSNIYMFMRNLLDHWPLDTSLMLVLDLWLSYIQPWRYTLNFTSDQRMIRETQSINNFYKFLFDNHIVYTHIFNMLIPRFKRLDYSTNAYVSMLHRVTKVITQPDLASKLNEIEKYYSVGSYTYDSPQRQSILRQSALNRSADWTSAYNIDMMKMFSMETCIQVEELLGIVNVSRLNILREIKSLQSKVTRKKKSQGFILRFINDLSGESLPEESRLNQIKKIPTYLTEIIMNLSNMYEINSINLSVDELYLQADAVVEQQQNVSKLGDDSQCFDITKINPNDALKRIDSLPTFQHPAELPICSYEIGFLVRFLYRLSKKINKIYGKEITELYHRQGYIGKLMRQILYGPMVVKWFDNPCGYNELFEKKEPPMLSLRIFASQYTLFVLLFACLVGLIIWHSPILGILLFFVIFGAIKCFLALIS